MCVYERSFCHFIVWTNKTCLIVTVPRDDVFLDNAIPKLELFWKKHCLTELLTHKLKNQVEPVQPLVPLPSGSRQLYCYCQSEDDGTENMVGCDNPSCMVQWVHYKCAKIKRAPKNQWYCKYCKKNKKIN